MSLTISARNAEGTFEQIGFVDAKTIDLTENAEEGSVAMSTITFDDPNLVFETVGHRAIAITDTEIVSGEVGIYHGYTADRTFKRGRMPLSRQVDLNVADLNSVWGRRVMVGADCKRPAETDVARMRWLITTAEAGLITDDTYLSSSSPVNMDKVDYRGQMMDQVANDCAQASGKNWGITYNFDTGDGYQVWYGHDELATYDSGVLITNIREDVDEVTSFYMADDTTLTLDPARVFSGVMVDWEKGKVYRQSAATAHAFARRDTIMSGKLVKTKTKAIARANRYLGTLDEEDVRIETSILVPRALGNVVRPFHRVQFQSTHLPGTIDAPIYCRVVKRRLSYWTPEFWRLSLTLVGGASAPPSPPGVEEALGSNDQDIEWTTPTESGQLEVAIMGRRGEPMTAGPDNLYGEWTLIDSARYDNGTTHDSQNSAYRVAGGAEGDIVSWGSISDRPTMGVVKFTGTRTVEDVFKTTGSVGNATMTLSGIVTSGPAVIVAGIRIHNFDTPPPNPTLTPPTDFVEVLSDHGGGGYDYGSYGYLEVDAAGTYSLTWSSSNASPPADWTYLIVAVVVT